MPNKEKTISLKVDPEMYSKLNEFAKKDSRSLSSYIRMVLTKVISGEIKL